MIILLKILVFLVLGAIAVQDFRYRAVSWYLFPLSAILLVALAIVSGKSLFEIGLVINLAFVAINVLLVSLIMLKGRFSLQELNQSFLGIGDILFFIVLAVALPFPLFPVFFVGTLIIGGLTGISIFRGKSIPLAGVQSVFLALIYLPDLSQVFSFNQYLTNSFING